MIYKYKTEGRTLKDFNGYQTLINLFTKLGDGNVNTTEVLKNNIDCKPDLGEINLKAKSEEQISAVKKFFLIFFRFKTKTYWYFLEIILFSIWS